MDLNKFGKRAYNCALKRGKIHSDLSGNPLHAETIKSLEEECHEVTWSSEIDPSEHLEQYPAVVEELADVAIVVFTELHRRGVDIEQVLHSKMKYNETRR